MYNLLQTKPFQDIFYQHTEEPLAVCLLPDVVHLSVRCDWVQRGQSLVITGNIDTLGQWNTCGAPKFRHAAGRWHILLATDRLSVGVQYKFVIINASGDAVQWEDGENRTWDLPSGGTNTIEMDFQGEARLWRGAGVAIPVFSLRSEQSAGIGDFADLARFARWAGSVGMQAVQILPINDTTITHTYKDSYPYNSNSTFALHPLYLSLEEMGMLKDADLAHRIADDIQRLNRYEALDYEGVERAKWQFFNALYEQEGEQILASEDCQRFATENQDWLLPYAVFSYLREVNGTADFTQWGEWTTYNAERAEALLLSKSTDYKQIAIYIYLQYHLDRQLRAAHRVATDAGVALKGDIPIGVSRHSVEAWTSPHLFHMDCQAGAPPDDFSATGQNWSFPTYNWEAMAADGYQWWRRRFEKMADYFDMYRIDHILGFFRIWQIPVSSVEGVSGQFNPALPFSRNELEEWGLPMDDQRFLEPYIHANSLKEVFGRYRNKYQQEFLDRVGDGDFFRLKPQFDTQRKIEAHFAATHTAAELRADAPEAELRGALYGLLDEVLFVCDSRDPERFHPRIAAHATHSYRALSEHDKNRFDLLYNHFFYHRHNDFWAAEALKKLPPLIGATAMMCCAEDLGMIPACVPSILNDLKISTLEIERMPKQCGHLFGDTTRYPYLSVCSTSTHDMSPLRQWWAENPDLTQRYYNEVMGWWGSAPCQATVDICRNIVERHLCSASMLVILPLQDWLSVDESLWGENPADERINIPSDPDHYWRYRMLMSIENLEEATDFTTYIRAALAV